MKKSEYFQHELRVESGADFDVYLFAMRQDREDFAFFVVSPDGDVEDSVIDWHLTFSGRYETFLKEPSRYSTQPRRTLMTWLRETAIPDIEDWISQDDDDPEPRA
jgi:hypothetical protein